jgi:hypothetical protein
MCNYAAVSRWGLDRSGKGWVPGRWRRKGIFSCDRESGGTMKRRGLAVRERFKERFTFVEVIKFPRTWVLLKRVYCSISNNFRHDSFKTVLAPDSIPIARKNRKIDEEQDANIQTRKWNPLKIPIKLTDYHNPPEKDPHISHINSVFQVRWHKVGRKNAN